MNWGLFLALTSFLIPLSFAVRLAVNAVWGRAGASGELQRLHLCQLLLVGALLCGKTPTAIYATTGREATLGHVTEAFMVTPWGFAQLACALLAIGLCEWSAPGLVARIEGHAVPAPSPRAYLKRHAGVLLICLGLAWAAARGHLS